MGYNQTSVDPSRLKEPGQPIFLVSRSASIRPSLCAAASPVNDRLYSPSGAVRAIAIKIVDEINADPTRKRRMRGTAYAKTLHYVTCLIVNFLILRLTAPDRRLAISQDHYEYDGGDFPYALCRGAVDYLAGFGYLHHARGYYDRAKGEGRVTQFWPTDRFAQLLDTLDHTAIAIRERKPLVEIRQSKSTTKAKRLACPACVDLKAQATANRKLPDSLRKHQLSEHCNKHRELTPVLPWPKKLANHRKRRVSNLRNIINPALAKQFQAVRVPDKVLQQALSSSVRPVNIFCSALHRVFTNSTQLVGRFVGAWWLVLPNTSKPEQRKVALRPHIMMAKPGDLPSPVAELDYEGLHFQMLYAQANVKCVGDPYSIYEDPTISQAARKLAKGCCLKLINASSRQKAVAAIRRKIHKRLYPAWSAVNQPLVEARTTDEKIALMWPGCPPLGQIIADIEARHAPIAKYLCTGIGRQLMFDDAEMAEGIMLRMLDETGVCPLQVFDSFIVPEHLADHLRQVMQQQFVAKFGVRIPIKATPPAKTPYELTSDDLYTRLLRHWSQTQTNKAVPVTA